MIVVHVYIKKHEGEYWFCVEMIITVHATNIRQTIQEWKSVAQYSAIHQELWGKFDMEPIEEASSADGTWYSIPAPSGGWSASCRGRRTTERDRSEV